MTTDSLPRHMPPFVLADFIAASQDWLAVHPVIALCVAGSVAVLAMAAVESCFRVACWFADRRAVRLARERAARVEASRLQAIGELKIVAGRLHANELARTATVLRHAEK